MLHPINRTHLLGSCHGKGFQSCHMRVLLLPREPQHRNHKIMDGQGCDASFLGKAAAQDFSAQPGHPSTCTRNSLNAEPRDFTCATRGYVPYKLDIFTGS